MYIFRFVFVSLCLLCATVAVGQDYTADYYQPYPDTNDYTAPFDTSSAYSASQGVDYGSQNHAADYSVDDSSGSKKIHLYPTQVSYEYLGGMDAKHGSGHASFQNLLLYMNVLDWGDKWKLTGDAMFRMSWFDGTEDASLDINELYTLRLSATLSYKLAKSTRVGAGISPEFSTDGDSWTSDNFMCGAHAFIASKVSDKLMGSIGIAYAPQLSDWPVIPFITFSWKTSPDWTLKFNGLRLSMDNKVTEGFTWGPFVSVVSGSWIVKYEKIHSRFEWRSGVVGVGAQIGLGKWSGVHPVLCCDLGYSFYNKAKYKTTDGEHNLSSKEYDGGVYVRAGLNLEF